MCIQHAHDPHSFFRSGQPQMVHVDWIACPIFDRHVINAIACITFDRGGEKTCLDIRDLSITSIVDENNGAIDFKLSDPHPVLGQSLLFMVPENPCVTIFYETSPNASGLQWLVKEQTLDKNQPFLFSQAQYLHARSFIPCQDTPSVRFTFAAKIHIPKTARSLMGAQFVQRFEYPVGERCLEAMEMWRMPQPIPAYLMAFAVGEIADRAIDDRCRVYAEPGLVEAAAKEFAQLGQMVNAAERLTGIPYPWERFDVLMLPPSFPFGGMENPRLAFLTPTLVTGDRSLVNVVIHELAHSWTGNLVTNATWCDLWLNEGWTVYLEWRITEELYGREEALLQREVLRWELERDLEKFARAGQNEFTALAPRLTDMVDPDDIFSRVPYCKGALFLVVIEGYVGRERFDAFMREYLGRFKFQSVDTAQFLHFVSQKLPGVLEAVEAEKWVYGVGMPSNTPTESSTLSASVTSAAASLCVPLERWSGSQWGLYLKLLPRLVPPELILELDRVHGLSTSQNTEVRFAFLLLALESGYDGYNQLVDEFLTKIGRFRYVIPLLKALANLPNGRQLARLSFDRVKGGYHPITVAQGERLLR